MSGTISSFGSTGFWSTTFFPHSHRYNTLDTQFVPMGEHSHVCGLSHTPIGYSTLMRTVVLWESSHNSCCPVPYPKVQHRNAHVLSLREHSRMCVISHTQGTAHQYTLIVLEEHSQYGVKKIVRQDKREDFKPMGPQGLLCKRWIKINLII